MKGVLIDRSPVNCDKIYGAQGLPLHVEPSERPAFVICSAKRPRRV